MMETRKTKPITVIRQYPAAPLVGVGAVVLNDEGEVLLVRRGKPPRAGEWSLPGGLIDLGERLEDAVRREVWEECAIDIAIGGFVATFEPILYDAVGEIEYHYVIIDFWATHIGGEAVAQDDAVAVIWSSIDRLDSFRVRPETHQVIKTAHAAWRAALDKKS